MSDTTSVELKPYIAAKTQATELQSVGYAPQSYPANSRTDNPQVVLFDSERPTLREWVAIGVNQLTGRAED
ncbi:hypothetical protein GGF43_003498 [Coemansia sp. RSA 2618]|nr:hypothetical protein GGF43_003498 [Coemansia sp. RSA 2618]